MADLVVSGARVRSESGWAVQDVVVRDGVVVDGPPAPAAERVDADGLLLAPGFVDLQCNGAHGIHLTDEPGRLWELAAALPAAGVTAWLPTIVTAAPGAVDAALAALAAGPPPDWVGAVPLGLHVEGPFLAPRRRGAHPERHLRAPSLEEAAGWSRDAGVGVVTLAPELPGALEVVGALVGRGVVVSIGHTDGRAEEVRAAIDAGARWVTHLFNGMAPLHHREPGLVGVALDDDRVHVGLIADGVHVGPEALRLAAKALGPRLTLVTDAVAAAGTPDAAGPDAQVRTSDGALAGSVVLMDGAVRTLVAVGAASIEQALAAASSNPAAILGDPSRGTLALGARADLVLLTPGLEVVATWVGGRRATPPSPADAEA